MPRSASFNGDLESRANSGLVPPPCVATQVTTNLRWYSETEWRNEVSVNWIVEGLVAPGGLAVVFGQPGAGKSHYVLDLLFRLARGAENIHGRKTRGSQEKVAYVGLEGGIGLRDRVGALATMHGPAPNFWVIGQCVDVIRQRSDLDKLVMDMNNLGITVLAIDTLSRMLGPADENSSTGMGAVLAVLDEIRQRTDAAIIAVHHAGKEQHQDVTRSSRSSPREHSSLLAAVDLAVHVERRKDCHVARVTKARDAGEGAPMPFALDLIDIFPGPDGERIKSICVRELDPAVLDRHPSGLHAKNRSDIISKDEPLLKLLHELAQLGGQNLHGNSNQHWVAIEAWRKSADEHGLLGAGKSDSRNRNFCRKMKAFRDCGKIGMDDTFAWFLPVQ